MVQPKSPSHRASMIRKALLLSVVIAGACALTERVGAQTIRPSAEPPRLTAYASAQMQTSEVVSASTSAAEIARKIDWDSVKSRYPIPESMPSSASDDPLEAGFAPQWATRALKDQGAIAASMPLQRKGVTVFAEPMALAIMSKKRAPGDLWAEGLERKLREIIHTQVDAGGPTVSRVFCNAVGCLCYMERDGADASAAKFGAITEPLTSASGWAKEFGIKPEAVYLSAFGSGNDFPGRYFWELVFVLRLAPSPTVNPSR